MASLLMSVLLVGVTSSVGVYDPWCDLDDDGDIDIFDVVRLAGAYNTAGEPFQAKAAIQFDSGWRDITTQCGRSFEIEHGLGSLDVMVDIQGRVHGDGGPHQRHLGGTGLTPGWSTTYGGASADVALSVVPTADGGYVLGGRTASFGAGYYDGWLGKTDAHGILQWNQTYGSTGGDYGAAAVATADGGYALAGFTYSFGAGMEDYWLVKTSANGTMEWQRTYGGANADWALSAVQTEDGGYALAGSTYSFGAGGWDAWLVKTYADGTFQWGLTYGGAADDHGHCVIQTADGGYALAGYTDSFGSGGYDAWLVKTNVNGVLEWQRAHGGPGSEEARVVVQTADGGYALACTTDSFGAGFYDAWLVKTYADGTFQWGLTYGGAGMDYASAVIQTGEGGYAVAGYTASFGAGLDDAWLVKTDAQGNMQWNRTYGGSLFDYAHAVVPTRDGGYVLAGSTDSGGAGLSDVWLVKTETELGLLWADSTPNTITLYRGATDPDWNFVRVRIWTIKDTP